VKIAIASDHAAIDLKAKVDGWLKALGHETVDFGTDSLESCDYPDFAYAASKAVSDGRCERAVLMCGSGIGMDIVANKVRGVRAALGNDLFAAEMARRHNDANVLCMGARIVKEDAASEIVRRFVDTPFEGGRHARRVAKIAAIEDRECGPCTPTST
jgi:ribose 5-phosphate isomerase B